MTKNFFVVLVAFIGLGISSAYAQNSIAKTAKQTLMVGENNKLKIEPTTDRHNVVYNDFKIVTSEDGSLTISFATFAERTNVALFNENGSSLKPVSEDVVSGNSEWAGNWWSENTIINNCLIILWNATVEKFVGSFTYKLDAGTYYLRIVRGQTGLSTANVSLKLVDLDGNEVK